MIKHYVAVKTDPNTLTHSEVDEYVHRYIGQLEHALTDERVKDTLFALYPRLSGLNPRTQDETEYLLSSEANKKRLDRSIAEFDKEIVKDQLERSKAIEYASEEFIEEYFDYLKSRQKPENDITPVKLLNLGFTEEYQEPECGDAGYLYYSLYVCGVALLSTSLDDKNGFYVFLDDDTNIVDYDKLEVLVSSLRSL